jgi:hypothetical protein
MSTAGRASAVQIISSNCQRCLTGDCIIGFWKTVSARLHVDILPISRLFLIQCSLNEELDCSMKVFFRAAILSGRYWPRRMDRLWEVLMKHLFPGCYVMALVHILELRKGVSPVKVTFFSSLVELRDSFVDGKFDTILSIILVDFNATSVLRIVALKIDDFIQVGVVIVPGLYDLI